MERAHAEKLAAMAGGAAPINLLAPQPADPATTSPAEKPPAAEDFVTSLGVALAKARRDGQAG